MTLRVIFYTALKMKTIMKYDMKNIHIVVGAPVFN